MRIKVCYHHTDSTGVVYYSHYLAFLEEARTEFLEGMGMRIPELAKQGIYFVVGKQVLDCEAPGRYGDVLDVRSWVSSGSPVRLNFEAEIRNQDNLLLAKGMTVLVCVDEQFKPKAMPENFRARMTAGKEARA
ncbi:MAG: thioesterase family protein [Candidatus Omnitrophica bacterium]|nr:thioesterase family protein [Candidatus Omnitrophota bacterium]